MSTSSPASSFCSSKQKHSTLAKYGAIYIALVKQHVVVSGKPRETYSIGRDIVSRNADDVLVGLVLRLVESQASLPRQNAHELLLWSERPRESIGRIRIEMDLYAFCILHRHQTIRLELAHPDLGRAREPSRSAEHTVQRHSCIGYTNTEYNLHNCTM